MVMGLLGFEYGVVCDRPARWVDEGLDKALCDVHHDHVLRVYRLSRSKPPRYRKLFDDAD